MPAILVIIRWLRVIFRVAQTLPELIFLYNQIYKKYHELMAIYKGEGPVIAGTAKSEIRAEIKKAVEDCKDCKDISKICTLDTKLSDLQQEKFRQLNDKGS